MTWNRSDNLATRDRKGAARCRTSHWRLPVCSVAIGIVGAGVICWVVFNRGGKAALEKGAPKESRTFRVEEVEPANVEKSQENVQTNRWPEKAPYGDGTWRHGDGPRSIAVTNGTLVTYPHYPKVQLILPHPAFAAPFKNLPDNEIARILSMQTGDVIIDAPLPEDFDEKFAQSLQEAIVINKDDTPEKIELKKQVIEARKMLEDAMNRGESPRTILEADAKELRRLMDMRDNYQRIINEEINAGASDQDIADIVTAANKALEGKGVETKVLLPYRIKLHIDREKAAGRVQD